MADILVPWRQVWTQPRAALRAAIAGGAPSLLLAPIASGVVQSLMQGATSQLGQRGVAATWILAGGLAIGSLWGLAQVHVVSLAVWTVGRDQANLRIPFRQVRSAVSLAYAPLGAALSAWLVATLLLGRGLYADPQWLAAAYGPGGALQVSLLYMGTLACLVWSLVLEVLAVAELQHSSIPRALGTLLAAGLLLGLVVLVLGIVAAILIPAALRAA